MTKVIGVRFRTAGKIYYFSPGKYEIKKGDHVIVETARGIEYGTVVAAPKDIEDEDQTVTVKKKVEKPTTTTEVTTETTTEAVTAETTRATTEATTSVTTQATTEQPSTEVFAETKHPDNKPKTGDKASLILAIIIAICSGMMAVIILDKKRREKEK